MFHYPRIQLRSRERRSECAPRARFRAEMFRQILLPINAPARYFRAQMEVPPHLQRARPPCGLQSIPARRAIKRRHYSSFPSARSTIRGRRCDSLSISAASLTNIHEPFRTLDDTSSPRIRPPRPCRHPISPLPSCCLVRLYWGWQFIGTGRGKLGDIQKVADYFDFSAHSVPTLNAVLAGTTECVGGLLLLVGLASRLTAIPLIFTMIVAYLTAENEALRAIFSDPDKFTGATPSSFFSPACSSLSSALALFSLDWLIGGRSLPE